MNPLNKQALLDYLPISLRQQMQLEYFDCINSTNDYLKVFAKENPIRELPFYICLADQQTAGRGRDEKRWHSPAGKNMYLSILWKSPQPASQLTTLSRYIGKLLIATLQRFTGISDFTLKHPNDIMYGQKKLAGILIEVVNNRSRNCDVVIGVGLNINLQNHNEINQPWTSLAIINRQEYPRNHLIAVIIRDLLQQMVNAFPTLS